MKQSFQSRFSDLTEKISYRSWIILAAVVSILLGIMVFFYLNDNSAHKSTDLNQETVQVVTAAQDIAPRAIIQGNMVKIKDIPKDMVPENVITDINDVVGKPASIQIMKDDIVTAKKILMDIKLAGFTGMIPADCRAVSVAINDVTGISGFAKPGDYVDVALVSGDNDSSRTTSSILLQNILLLGINKTSIANNPAQVPTNAKDGDTTNQTPNAEQAKNDTSALATATLAVTPRDAMKLLAGAHSGTVYLVLRPYKPQNTFTASTEYSIQHRNKPQPAAAPAPASSPVYTAPPRQPAPSTPAAPAAPKAATGIEVIRGTTATREGA